MDTENTGLTQKQSNRILAILLALFLVFSNMAFLQSMFTLAAEIDVSVNMASFEPQKEVYESGDVIRGSATLTNTTNKAINGKSIVASISPSVGDVSLSNTTLTLSR